MAITTWNLFVFFFFQLVLFICYNFGDDTMPVRVCLPLRKLENLVTEFVAYTPPIEILLVSSIYCSMRTCVLVSIVWFSVLLDCSTSW